MQKTPPSSPPRLELFSATRILFQSSRWGGGKAYCCPSSPNPLRDQAGGGGGNYPARLKIRNRLQAGFRIIWDTKKMPTLSSNTAGDTARWGSRSLILPGPQGASGRTPCGRAEGCCAGGSCSAALTAAAAGPRGCRGRGTSRFPRQGAVPSLPSPTPLA